MLKIKIKYVDSHSIIWILLFITKLLKILIGSPILKIVVILITNIYAVNGGLMWLSVLPISSYIGNTYYSFTPSWHSNIVWRDISRSIGKMIFLVAKWQCYYGKNMGDIYHHINTSLKAKTPVTQLIAILKLSNPIEVFIIWWLK